MPKTSLNLKKKFKLYLITIGLFGLLLTPGVHANNGSITVAPAFLRVSLSKQTPVQEETVSVRNNFQVPVRLSASLYGVDQESGNLTAKDEPDPELTKVISLSQTEFTLQPNQSINIKLSVRDSPDLTPGGHYASLLIKQIAEPGSGVGLQSAVSVTIYVIKEDGAKRDLSLKPLYISSIRLTMPTQESLTFSNKGNVAVTPRASTKIESGGKIFATGTVNEGSLPVYPGKELTLSSNLSTLKRAWLPGKFNIQIKYRYSGASEEQKINQSFWCLPWQFLIFTALFIALCYYKRLAIISKVSKLRIIIIKKLSGKFSKKDKKLKN